MVFMIHAKYYNFNFNINHVIKVTKNLGKKIRIYVLFKAYICIIFINDNINDTTQ